MKFTSDQSAILNIVLNNATTDNTSSVAFEILNLSIETDNLSIVLKLSDIEDLDMLTDVLTEEGLEFVITTDSLIVETEML